MVNSRRREIDFTPALARRGAFDVSRMSLLKARAGSQPARALDALGVRRRRAPQRLRAVELARKPATSSHRAERQEAAGHSP